MGEKKRKKNRNWIIIMLGVLSFPSVGFLWHYIIAGRVGGFRTALGWGYFHDVWARGWLICWSSWREAAGWLSYLGHTHIAAEGKFFSKFISSLVSHIHPHLFAWKPRCDDLQLSLRAKCFMGLLPVSLLLDDPPCDEFQLPLSLSLGVFFCTSKSHLCPLHHLAMFFCNPRLPPEGCKLENYQQYVIKWTDLERRMWPIVVWSILIAEAP